jgi:hypothetical protein
MDDRRKTRDAESRMETRKEWLRWRRPLWSGIKWPDPLSLVAFGRPMLFDIEKRREWIDSQHGGETRVNLRLFRMSPTCQRQSCLQLLPIATSQVLVYTLFT